VPKQKESPRFTLGQVIAWIAWMDPDRSLGSTRPPQVDYLERDPPPPKLSSWWEENSQRERAIWAAARALAEAITAGRLEPISGTLVINGSPTHGAPDSENHDPIPRETTRLPCEIPEVSIEMDGGWVYFTNGKENGWETGPRYCHMTFNENLVRKLWEAPLPTDGVVYQSMKKEAERFYETHKVVAKKAHLVAYTMEATGCQTREAQAAFGKLPDSLRRPRHGGRPEGRQTQK